MWSDNDTVQDLIGFRVHADLIADVVTDSKLLPLTMGVFGEWGNGKTSIMKMLQKKLLLREDIAVLYFDAWLFEGYDDAKSALISSIIKQLSEHKRFPQELRDQARDLVKRVNWMRLLKMGWDNVALPAILAYATGGATAVPGLLGGLKTIFFGKAPDAEEGAESSSALHSDQLSGLIGESAKEDFTAVRDFRDEFDSLLQKTNFRSLVVLIDDLDRCSPDRIVENLEAIKLFLNVGNTAFIIGADPRIVRHAIAVRYRESLEAAKAAASPGESATDAGEQLVRDYVEKLIQVPYHLPRLSPAEIETYLCLLFSQRDLSSEDFAVCLSACDARREANRFGAFGLADIQESLDGRPISQELREALSFTGGAAQLITENLKGNPRQVKRFLNAFVLRQKLARVAKIRSLRDDVLLKLMLLEYSNEARFRELARWQEEQGQTAKELIDLEQGKPTSQDWDKPSLMRWAQMEPHLSNVELSEYFWLARDRLASSLVGLSLIPPAVKACYAALLSETGRKQCDILLKDLRPSEIDSMLDLLTKHAQREPKDPEAYNALLRCSDIHVQGLTTLQKLVTQVPPEAIPAWLSVKLQLLAKRQDLKSAAEAVIDTLKGLGAGRASKASTLERGRR